jgi:phosphate-selective porin OprO and OprP
MSIRLSILFLLVSATTSAQPTPAPAQPPLAEPPPAEPPTADVSPVLEATPTPPTPTGEATVTATAAPLDVSAKVEPKLEVKPEPKQLEIKPGGYLQADTRAFATDTGTHEQTLRRLRFKVEGKAFRYFKFNTLIETAQSKLQVLNAWIELAPRPEIGLRFGKDKAQFGIERLQSATELTFIERAYPTQIAPNRDIGLAVRGDLRGGLVHYSAGIVNGVADNAVLEGETDDEYEYNVHLLVSPFKAIASYGDLGVGGAATFGRTHGTLANPGITPIKSAGQATIFKFAGGGAMDTLDSTAVTDGYRHRLAAHAYYYVGPVGTLAEYVADYEPIVLQGSHTLVKNQAWQLAGSAALTPGDKPTYKSIAPKRPFDLDAGTWGAVELAARYSELRIDDDAFMQGIAKDTASVRRARAGTLGVNWYFNKYIKLQLNYEATLYKGGAETGDRPTEHLISTRFQAAI